MIERENGIITFICDSCDDCFEGVTNDFKTEWATAKAQGWRAFKNNDDQWEHACPDCD